MADDFDPSKVFDLTPFLKGMDKALDQLSHFDRLPRGLLNTGPITITATWLPLNTAICVVCQRPFNTQPDQPRPWLCDPNGPIGHVCDPCAMAFINDGDES